MKSQKGKSTVQNMQKDVLIIISGVQDEYEGPPIMQTVSGEHYFKDGKHYLLYEEVVEDMNDNLGNNKCKMIISPNQVEIIKKGYGNLYMNFMKDKKTVTSYASPFGNIITGFYTHRIDIFEEEGLMELNLSYELEMNGAYISECEIRVQVKPR